MKSIYKKISVGVLAAALLVGGSGLVKGGQAFAYENGFLSKENNLEEYLEQKREEDRRMSLSYGYGRSSDRRRVVWAARDLGFKFKEVDRFKNGKKVHSYSDGWIFNDKIKEEIENSDGELNVQVGSLKFIIRK